MSKTVNHRNGTKTVTFSDGHKATFGKPKSKKITGTPYIFAAGSKIELPSSAIHGTVFSLRGKTYVALHYKGKDTLGRRIGACYGQPITLTRS